MKRTLQLVAMLILSFNVQAKVEIPCEAQANEALKALGKPTLASSGGYAVKGNDGSWFSYKGFADQDKNLDSILEPRKIQRQKMDEALRVALASFKEILGTRAEVAGDSGIKMSAIEHLVSSGEYSAIPEMLDRKRVSDESFEGERALNSLKEHMQKTNEDFANCKALQSDCPKSVRDSLEENKKALEKRIPDFTEQASQEKARHEKLNDVLKRVKELVRMKMDQSRGPLIYESAVQKDEESVSRVTSCVTHFKSPFSDASVKNMQRSLDQLTALCTDLSEDDRKKCSERKEALRSDIDKSDAFKQCLNETNVSKKLFSQNGSPSLKADFAISFQDDKSLYFSVSQDPKNYGVGSFSINSKTCEFTPGDRGHADMKASYKTFADFVLDLNQCRSWINADENCGTYKKSLEAARRSDAPTQNGGAK